MTVRQNIQMNRKLVKSLKEFTFTEQIGVYYAITGIEKESTYIKMFAINLKNCTSDVKLKFSIWMGQHSTMIKNLIRNKSAHSTTVSILAPTQRPINPPISAIS
ncbi:hypothetical protein BpHYR1_000396 [Brachionus plicatilis]|uniref:Uncharacterized protein n=1 Tax=Brachionus plicatilis TaxID=10195 RepID=A0A3M7Q5K0_BRAPC|nr:hypothetical protein BpHYR1_000396 [Brachionus plicatilis]